MLLRSRRHTCFHLHEVVILYKSEFGLSMLFFVLQKLEDAITETQKNPKIQVVEDIPDGN